jgi:hypothetical protein
MRGSRKSFGDQEQADPGGESPRRGDRGERRSADEVLHFEPGGVIRAIAKSPVYALDGAPRLAGRASCTTGIASICKA